MSLSLNKPSTGATGWADAVNANFATIEDSLLIARGICQARLTLSSTDPVTTGSLTSQSTLYLLPFMGNQIGLYDTTSSQWTLQELGSSGLSFKLTGDGAERDTSGSPIDASKTYDVFVWNDSGTLKLALEIWSTNTARANALDVVQGVCVRGSNSGYLYVGTVWTDSNTDLNDAAFLRFVWNEYHRVPVRDYKADLADSWTDAGNGTWSEINTGSSAFKCQFVVGRDLRPISARVKVTSESSYHTAIAQDGTTYSRSTSTIGSGAGTVRGAAIAEFSAFPGVGYHYLQGIETTQNSSTATAWGDNGGTIGGSTVGIQSGMFVDFER